MTPSLIERWACVFPPCHDDSGCEKFVTELSTRSTSFTKDEQILKVRYSEVKNTLA